MDPLKIDDLTDAELQALEPASREFGMFCLGDILFSKELGDLRLEFGTVHCRKYRGEQIDGMLGLVHGTTQLADLVRRRMLAGLENGARHFLSNRPEAGKEFEAGVELSYQRSSEYETDQEKRDEAKQRALALKARIS